MNKQERLGYYDDPNEAHLAWKAKKHEIALIYTDMQTDERVAYILRTRYL